MEPKDLNVKLDLAKDTKPVYSEDGNMIFEEKVIFRKISRFLTGQQEDTMLPITVFIDVKTGKPLKELLPKQLWSEFGYTEDLVSPIVSSEIPRTDTPIMKINKD